jgi:hypothetical protein
MYLDGGMIGIFFLIVMLLGVAVMSNSRLKTGGNYAVLRFAFLVIMLIANYTESYFGRMTPLGFVFLLTALEVPRYRQATVNRGAQQRPDLRSRRPVAAPLASTLCA